MGSIGVVSGLYEDYIGVILGSYSGYLGVTYIVYHGLKMKEFRL